MILIDEDSITLDGRRLTLVSTLTELRKFGGWSEVLDTAFDLDFRTDTLSVAYSKNAKEIIGFGIFSPADAVMPDDTRMGEPILAAEARGWRFSNYESAWKHPQYPTLSLGNEVEDPFDDQTGLGTVCMMFLSHR
jgi:hypothetical protein